MTTGLRIATSAVREVPVTPALDYDVAKVTAAAPLRGSHPRLLKASPRTTEESRSGGIITGGVVPAT